MKRQEKKMKKKNLGWAPWAPRGGRNHPNDHWGGSGHPLGSIGVAEPPLGAQGGA
jgi:hypothetical protein